MDSFDVFAKGMANANNKTMKVFDRAKALNIIRERNAKEAMAGLVEDWFWTGGTIMEEGKLVKPSCIWLSSTWATPVIIIDDEPIECWYEKNSLEVTEEDTQTPWNDDTIKLFNEGVIK